MASRDRDPGGGEPFVDLFEEAMRDVQPLTARPAPVPRPPSRARRRDPAGATARTVRFEIETVGERVFGRTPGFDRRELRRLERGALPPETSVDLHGALAAEARELVRATLRGARGSGARIVRIVHGRGLHSPDGPVLKTALPGWLAEPPLGSWVLAFASAPPELGGPGATLVLLRRRERRRR